MTRNGPYPQVSRRHCSSNGPENEGGSNVFKTATRKAGMRKRKTNGPHLRSIQSVQRRSHDERLLSPNCQPSSVGVLEARETIVNTKRGRTINITSATWRSSQRMVALKNKNKKRSFSLVLGNNTNKRGLRLSRTTSIFPAPLNLHPVRSRLTRLIRLIGNATSITVKRHSLI
jgi:hypothetical protein